MVESSCQGDAFLVSLLHASKEGYAPGATIELAPGMYYLENFGNIGAVVTSEGMVLIDTGNYAQPQATLQALRQLTDQPMRYIIYTHGHLDHAANTLPILCEAAERGDARPHVTR